MEKKEAMKILKDFHDKSALFSVRTALDTIIPELRESEDERIMKDVKRAISVALDYSYFDKETANNCLAWLEKQGYTKKDVDDAYLKGICNTKHELEKQSEQKSVDKIEPKFHEGEWIISNDKKSTYQVIEVKRGIYVIRDNVDNHEYHIGIEECEKSGRLFTIQDAKAGDVLCYKDEISLYKHDIKNCTKQETTFGGFVYYCCYDGKRFIMDSLYSLTEQDKPDIHPAAKEQRDLLFQKMKEAGYGWDSEKKELKKLSQRVISAEAKEALYDKPTDEEMKELLRTEYEKGRADTLSEMKSSWSEEDEVKINRIVACLENLNVADNDILLKDVDWLKSLKDRVIPKPKHEWSIEDERTIAIINNALTESNTPPDDYDKVYDWLESLKKRIGG